MDLLLYELEPPPVSYRTAVVSLTAVATLGVGLAVWLAVRPGEAAGRTCDVEARERAATAWSPERAKEIEQRFAGSGRSYASSMAREAVAGLDRYATRCRIARIKPDRCGYIGSLSDQYSSLGRITIPDGDAPLLICRVLDQVLDEG